MHQTVHKISSAAVTGMYSALLGSMLLLGACSKNTEPAPAPLTAKPVTSDLVTPTFSPNPAIAGGGEYSTSISWNNNMPFYTYLSSHPEMADEVNLEFRQSGVLKLVARSIFIEYYQTASNIGTPTVPYGIPTMLANGTYDVTVRAPSGKSLTARYSSSDPVISSITASLTVTRNRPSSFVSNGMNSLGIYPYPYYYYNYTFSWNTSNFGTSNALRLRAFASNGVTIYQLTPSFPQAAFAGSGFSNSGSENVPLNYSGQPAYLPDGSYNLLIDNQSTRYIGGDAINIGQ